MEKQSPRLFLKSLSAFYFLSAAHSSAKRKQTEERSMKRRREAGEAEPVEEDSSAGSDRKRISRHRCDDS